MPRMPGPPSDDDIEKGLRDIGGNRADYPPELYTSTRAEFLTRIRKNQPKKPGCPLFTVMVLGLFGSIVWLVVAIF